MSHATKRAITAAVAGVGLAAAMTACGQHVSAAATASSTSHTKARCTTDELSVTLGHGSGAAGHFYVPVAFTNEGTTACTITGYPGVSYVTGKGGDQIGDAAVRTPASVSTVTLQPGQQAAATVDQVDVANYPAEACQQVDAAGLRVYPPNTTVPVFLAEPNAHACAKHMPGQHQLSVDPVRLSPAQPPAS
jgi:hypothetical protein